SIRRPPRPPLFPYTTLFRSERIGWQYAMELLLTGERIDAGRAHEIGLAGWVVPHDQLLDEARALADRLVRAAPLAARSIKEVARSEEHTSELQSPYDLVCRL